MQIKKFLNHTIITHHCDHKEYYTNEDIYNSIDYVFGLEHIKNSVDTYQRGMALSTVRYYNDFPLLELPGSEKLISWIRERIIESTDSLGYKDVTDITFGRTWINLMFEGCEGACHDHNEAGSGVAIFYANVPKNSSDLVLVEGGVNNTKLSDYDPSQCFPIQLTSGDLVIHDPLLPHAVTRHNNQEPRICFIFEFRCS